MLGAGLGQVHVAAVGVGVVVLARDEFADQPDDLDPRLSRGGVVPASTSGTSASSTSTESASSISATSGFGRHQVLDVGDQLVAQHVEADLVDRGVGDVAAVGGAALVGAWSRR